MLLNVGLGFVYRGLGFRVFATAFGLCMRINLPECKSFRAHLKVPSLSP